MVIYSFDPNETLDTNAVITDCEQPVNHFLNSI